MAPILFKQKGVNRMKEKYKNGIKFGVGLAVSIGVVRAARCFMPMAPTVYDYLTIGTAGVIFGLASQELVADQVERLIDWGEDAINGNSTMIVM